MKIIRKNKKSKDCTVVAAFNAASWCNSNKQYREVEKMAKSCGYSLGVGMYAFQFSNLLNRLKVPYRAVQQATIEELERAFRKGNFFVFLYKPTGIDFAHAVSAFLDHEGEIRLINPDSERSSWSRFTRDMSTYGATEFKIYEIPARSVVKTNDVIRSA